MGVINRRFIPSVKIDKAYERIFKWMMAVAAATNDTVSNCANAFAIALEPEKYAPATKQRQ